MNMRQIMMMMFSKPSYEGIFVRRNPYEREGML